MELRAIWSTILRRKWIIIQAFLFISLSAIIGSYLLTPAYETTAKILIKSSDPESYLLSNIGLDSKGSSKDALAMKIEDHIELVTSRPVMEKVISRLQLTNRAGDLIMPDKFRSYTWIMYEMFPRPSVEVDIVEQEDMDTESSNQIEITARATDPDEAAMIANTVAEEYIAENLRMKKEDYKTVRNLIEKQIGEVKAKYIKILENIKKFQIDEKTINLESETNESVSRMFDLMKEKEDNIIKIAEVRAEIGKLQYQLNQQNEMKVSSSSINENTSIEQLRRNIIEFQLQLEEELVEKKQAHPDVVILNRKLKEAKKELRKEIDLMKVFSTDLQSAERELAALEAHRISLDEEIDRYMVEFYAIPEKVFGDTQLKLDYQTNYNVYSSLLDYLHKTGVTESVISPDVVLVEAATPPDIDEPYSPDMVMDSILGVSLGLMFGFLLGFLVEYMDDTVKGVKDVKEHGLAMLGSVPRIKRKRSALIVAPSPKDNLVEFYRTIRNSIKFSSQDRPLKSFLVTSSVNGEGRSSVVFNLGIAIAREGKRVLIVDTDFHNPMLDQLTGVSSQDGITNILAEKALSDDVIKKIENIEGLSLLTAGSPPSDPCRMIESEKMRHLISDLTKQYEIVILDSPPLLVSNDAISLGRYVDASLFVLESGRISHSSLSRIIEHLKSSYIQLTGVIVNKFAIKRRGELL